MNNIYEGNKIEGWMSPAELQFLYENASKMNSVLEIGSWKGRSTHAILSGCKGRVVAVDHFKGSEGEDQAHAEAKGEDEPVYKEFMKNVGMFSNLEVVKASSREASVLLKDQKFDMIFIDGGHRYQDVREDIDLWRPHANILLCGHDYTFGWVDVVAAVFHGLGNQNPTGSCDSIWFLNIK